MSRCGIAAGCPDCLWPYGSSHETDAERDESGGQDHCPDEREVDQRVRLPCRG